MPPLAGWPTSCLPGLAVPPIQLYPCPSQSLGPSMHRPRADGALTLTQGSRTPSLAHTDPQDRKAPEGRGREEEGQATWTSKDAVLPGPMDLCSQGDWRLLVAGGRQEPLTWAGHREASRAGGSCAFLSRGRWLCLEAQEEDWPCMGQSGCTWPSPGTHQPK